MTQQLSIATNNKRELRPSNLIFRQKFLATRGQARFLFCLSTLASTFCSYFVLNLRLLAALDLRQMVVFRLPLGKSLGSTFLPLKDL